MDACALARGGRCCCPVALRSRRAVLPSYGLAPDACPCAVAVTDARRGRGDARWHASCRRRGCCPMSASRPILLQKSKVAGLKIFRENTKQRAIADSYDLNRVTEVACEFCVRP
jgi:hypothetical protein